MTEASRLEEDFSFNLPVEISILEKCELNTCKLSIENFNYEIIDDDILRSNIDVLIEGRELIEEKDPTIAEDREEKIEQEEQEVKSIDTKEECDDKERECDGDSKDEKEKEIPMKPASIEKENIEIDAKIEPAEPTMADISTVTDTSKELEHYMKKIDEIKITSKEETKTTTTTNTNSLFSNLTDEADSFSTYSIYILREGDTLEKVMEKYNITKEKLQEYNDLGTITLNSKIIIPNSINE
jgi:LysM repeat protein